MEHQSRLVFGPFCLDVTHGRLWRGEQVIALRPRSLAVLRYLAEHPGRLVTKAELQRQVWAGTHVTASVLRVSITEIRAALGDSATAPRYLETVGQQGYRFLAGGDVDMPPPLTTGLIVGRQRDVALLEQWYQDAVGGTRRLGFVSGDVGIGKTTVLDLFRARLAQGAPVCLGQGQCVESYGEGEPYLPFLEALGQLSRGPTGPEVLAVLRRYAPMWLVQLPGLLGDADLERVQRQVQGATPARMRRELAEALQVLTLDRPLVLVLEDLHWSDPSTVECLAFLAQRREPARLLVLGTYRPAEAVIRAHPLRPTVQELYGRGLAVELHLERLSAADVAAYVAGRLAGPVAAPLAAFVHIRTDGHALFMTNIVEHLVQQGLVGRREGQWTLREGSEASTARVPEGLRQLLVRRLEALPSEAQRVLEAASVVGDEFAVASVAAGAQCSVEEVEAVCEGLAAHHHLIDEIGLAEWPDGTSGGRYRFRHVLYQQVLYERLGTARRLHLHQRIGTRLAAGYGARAREIASQLAVHFERGGETQQAVHAWQQAAEHAARRNAQREAITHLTTGLALLGTLPESPERTRHELTLQLALGELWMAAKGITAPEVGEVYTRAHALCAQVAEGSQLARALWGLFLFQGAQGQLRSAGELGQQLLQLAQRQPDTGFVPEGHFAMGGVALYRGDCSAARAHLEHSLRLADPLPSSTLTLRGGFVPGVTPLVSLAQALWLLGYADQAQQRSQEALARARQAEHFPSLEYAHLFAAQLAQCRRDVAATRAHADAAMALAAAQGFGFRSERIRILQGWALAMAGSAVAGLAQIRQGLAASQGVGPELFRSYWLSFLAEAYDRTGQPEAGLTVLAEALTLVATTEVRWWEAELWRLKGALLLQLPISDVQQAAACFRQALEVARRQQAKALELRAALSLSRLWQRQGKRDEARQLLAPVYGWFTEGFDTADLHEARALLEELN